MIYYLVVSLITNIMNNKRTCLDEYKTKNHIRWKWYSGWKFFNMIKNYENY